MVLSCLVVRANRSPGRLGTKLIKLLRTLRASLIRLFIIYKNFPGNPVAKLMEHDYMGHSGSNGTSFKVVLFSQMEYFKRKFVFHFFKAIFGTSFRPSRLLNHSTKTLSSIQRCTCQVQSKYSRRQITVLKRNGLQRNAASKKL